MHSLATEPLVIIPSNSMLNVQPSTHGIVFGEGVDLHKIKISFIFNKFTYSQLSLISAFR